MVGSPHLQLWVWPDCGFFVFELELKLFMLKNNHYLYVHRQSGMEMLDSFRPIQEELVFQHSAYSPLNLFQWRLLLAEHPGIHFKSFTLEGGFWIGFNLHSILELTNRMNPEASSIVSEYLQRELSLARMNKLHPYFQHPSIHISPLGIIPKENKPGKWWLIVDLSWPGVMKEAKSLTGWSARPYFQKTGFNGVTIWACSDRILGWPAEELSKECSCKSWEVYG